MPLGFSPGFPFLLALSSLLSALRCLVYKHWHDQQISVSLGKNPNPDNREGVPYVRVGVYGRPRQTLAISGTVARRIPIHCTSSLLDREGPKGFFVGRAFNRCSICQLTA
jgi:hypothetical protein